MFAQYRRRSWTFTAALAGLSLVALAAESQAQTTPSAASGTPSTGASPVTLGNARELGEADEIVRLYNLQPPADQLSANPSGCPASLTLAQLSAQIRFSAALQTATLDVDSTLSEIANERGELSDLRASLQQRRDRTVARLNTAALLTGSGLGTAISATQFTTLPPSVQNTGDAIGIGSAVASTILTLLANKRQSGPSGTVGTTPNMLAPLLGGRPNGLTSYTPQIMGFLHGVPPGEEPSRGTRLEQLHRSWVTTGRLGGKTPKAAEQRLAAAISSGQPEVSVTIGDLSDRIDMLGELAGEIGLMKRDLAVVARRFNPVAGPCGAPSTAK